jgi:hypothetical protein
LKLGERIELIDWPDYAALDLLATPAAPAAPARPAGTPRD